MIIRKPGQRHCLDCIQEAREPGIKQFKQLHAWAAIGWNFKSELYLCEVLGNTNGKMSMQIYRDEVLKKVVGSWLSRRDQFVQEEDGDYGHGTGKKNIVRDWKKRHGLKCYFNIPGSPDFSRIESAWDVVEQRITMFPSSTEEELRSFAIEAWNVLSQESVNGWVDSMVQRMQDVVERGGSMTNH